MCENMAKKDKGYPAFEFVTVDTETTGLDAVRNEIIEIGALRFEQDQVIETFQTKKSQFI